MTLLQPTGVPSMGAINDAITSEIATAIAPYRRMATGVFAGTADGSGAFTVTHDLGVVPICQALIVGLPGSGAGSRIIHLVSATMSQATFQITLSTTGAADANSTQDVHWMCVEPS